MSQWRDIATVLAGKTIDVARASANEVGNRIIQITPVDSGQLKNSWNTSIGAPEHEKRHGDANGSDSISELLEVSKTVETGQVMYFNNPQIYAPRIEYEGWSMKSPSGMVGINLIHWDDIVAQKARELKK